MHWCSHVVVLNADIRGQFMRISTLPQLCASLGWNSGNMLLNPFCVVYIMVNIL